MGAEKDWAGRSGEAPMPHRAVPLLPVPLRHHDAHLPFWSAWTVPAAPLSQVQMVTPCLPPHSPLCPHPQLHSEKRSGQNPNGFPAPSIFSFQLTGTQWDRYPVLGCHGDLACQTSSAFLGGGRRGRGEEQTGDTESRSACRETHVHGHKCTRGKPGRG